MASKFREKVKALGYSKQAEVVNELTRLLRSRSGIHFYNKVEVASVFDLVSISIAKFNQGQLKKKPCRIKEWHQVFNEAKKRGIRLMTTARHELFTDTGPVPIPKEGDSETMFVALEDFDAYLEIIAEKQKGVGKCLKEGWAKAQEATKQPAHHPFAFNF